MKSFMIYAILKNAVKRAFMLAIGAFILGSLAFLLLVLLGEEPTGLPLAILVSVIIVSTLVGFLLGVGEAFQPLMGSYFEGRGVDKFLGENLQIVATSVMRSADGKHQFRDEMSEQLHYHLEVIEPERSLVLENFIIGKIELGRCNDERSETSNYFTRVSKPKLEQTRVVHWHGFPPNLVHWPLNRTQLPWPQILLLRADNNGCFLIRFTTVGQYAGDTWHQSVEEAKGQAKFEYDVANDTWQMIPDEVDDILNFVSNM